MTIDARERPGPMKQAATYDIFISYSHQDIQFAVQLESAVRKYRAPFASGLQPKRLSVFRDETEAASPFLSEALGQAIAASRKLIVICSPAARRSRWVNDEIALFIRSHGIANLVPVLVAGLPNDEAIRLGRDEDCAFPPSLIDAMPGMPWCPDFRTHPPGAGGIAKVWPAWFHLLAAVYDVPREAIEQNERRRRIHRAAAGVAVVLGSVALGWSYLEKRNDARSLDLANQAEALRSPVEFGRALALAIQAVEAAPTPRATDVLATLVDAAQSRPKRASTVAVSPDGSRIAQASSWGSSVLFDVGTNQQRRLCRFVQPVTFLAFSPDSRLLVAYSENDRHLQVFDTMSAKRLGVADLDEYRLGLEVVFSPDSRSAVITSLLSTPELRRLPSAALVKRLKEGRGHSQATYNAQEGVFATFPKDSLSGSDSGMALWDTQTGDLIWRRPEGEAFDYVVFPKSGRQILAHQATPPLDYISYFMAGELREARYPQRFLKLALGDIDYGSLSYKGAPDVDPVLFRELFSEHVAEFHPELVGKLGRDAPTMDGKTVRTLEFAYLTLSPSGSTAFAEVYSSEHAILLSLPDFHPRLLIAATASKRPVYSANGRIVAIALQSDTFQAAEERLVAWATDDGRELWTRKGVRVDDYLFSPDSTRVIASSRPDNADSIVLVLDAGSGRVIATLPHSDTRFRNGSEMMSRQLSLLFVDRGGHKLVSRTGDSAYVWDIDTAIQRARINVFAEDEARRKANTAALSGPNRVDALKAIARNYLNACPGT